MAKIGIALFFVFILHSSCNKKPNSEVVLGLQVMGTFPKNIKDSIALGIRKEYGFRVVTPKAQKMPSRFFVNIKSPRYRADSIIRHLRFNSADSLDHVLGLTNFDISTTKTDRFGRTKKPESRYEDWGIFGLGYLGVRGSVVSTFRVKHKNPSLFVERMKKIAIHEIGHNLGLPHCEIKGCVMSDAAETIKTVDHVNSTLCKKCRSKIYIR